MVLWSAVVWYRFGFLWTGITCGAIQKTGHRVVLVAFGRLIQNKLPHFQRSEARHRPQAVPRASNVDAGSDQ